MYTIVTALFDIGRGSWNRFKRPMDFYFERAKRVFSLDDYMVIFIQPEWVDFVKENRSQYPNKTKIIPIKVEELPYYKYVDQIADIMQDPAFRKGLAVSDCPEVLYPLYDVLMWSKIPFIAKVIEENPFQTSHFMWLDIGVHTQILKDSFLGKPLLPSVSDKIKMLCLKYPSKQYLDIKSFFKSHTYTLSGTMITGSAENFKTLNQYFDEEVRNCLNLRVVDNDQSLFCIIFLKHPELFELYYGWWGELFANYYQITQNLVAVLHIAFTCREEGELKVYEEILDSIKNYTPKMWEY